VTPLLREIVRKVPRARGRAIVVRLVPERGDDPARIEFREARTRRWYPLPVESIFIEAVRRYVDRERAARRGRRRRPITLLRGTR
jgi:hypothetical protein